MDFSQHNKINSIVPPQIKNQNDYYSNNCVNMFSQNKFMSKNFQHPKCGSHQSNNFVPQHHQSMMQQPQESSNRNFMHKMTKNFEPYSFNTSSPENYCMPASSYFNPDSYSGHEVIEQQQHQQQQMQQYEDEMNEINVEYFQCTPPIPKRNECPIKSMNPFRPIMESMQKFSDNSVRQRRKEKIGDTVNSQTFFYSYNSKKEDEKPEYMQRHDEQSFKSFTKIISIPNGVKIITEIKKDDNINDPRDQNGSNTCNTDNDKWLNKQIEVTLDNMDEVDCEDGNDNDSSEFCTDEEKN